ncbi:hypothetical protein GC163_14795 [bacterium]|nr:hypothetical protein [bacterium]
MTPRTEQIGCRLSLPMWCIGLVVWSFCSDAWAGCGSYLLPPVSMAQHEQLPQELRVGRLYGRHNEAPCRGPQCHARPRGDIPMPSVPSLPVTSATDWATCPPIASWQLAPRELLFAMIPTDDSVETAGNLRLERPPRL